MLIPSILSTILMTVLERYSIRYSKVSQVELPKSLADLADPVYAGQISVTDMEGSSTGWLMVQAIADAYGTGEEGREILTGIYRNTGPHLQMSGSDPLNSVRSGEVALGFGTFLKDHQGPIITTFTYPEGVSFDFADMYAFIKERGYAIYPGKLTDEETFRLGNIGEIYPDDIRRVTELFAMYMAERGLLEPCAGTTDIATAIEAMDEAAATL